MWVQGELAARRGRGESTRRASSPAAPSAPQAVATASHGPAGGRYDRTGALGVFRTVAPAATQAPPALLGGGTGHSPQMPLAAVSLWILLQPRGLGLTGHQGVSRRKDASGPTRSVAGGHDETSDAVRVARGCGAAFPLSPHSLATDGHSGPAASAKGQRGRRQAAAQPTPRPQPPSVRQPQVCPVPGTSLGRDFLCAAFPCVTDSVCGWLRGVDGGARSSCPTSLPPPPPHPGPSHPSAISLP